MKKNRAALLLLVGALLASYGIGNAETRTLRWSAVTTYTDNTPIEPTKTVTYDVYWTTDATLSPASLHAVATSIAQTSTTFDPGTLGIPRGQTVYFTGDAVLSTGEKSALSSAYAWNVPSYAGLSISGPSSVNEGSSGTYTATATWSDNTTSTVTPTWSENSSYASISAGGVLTASAVTSSQTATVTASYTSGGVTRTATRSVTIVDVPAPAPAAPMNMILSGPVETVPARRFMLQWDPVTTYADGTTITSGSISYSAYWSADPGLAPGTLRNLGSTTTQTSVTFDPDVAGMAQNQRVYLTARANLSSGEQSLLASAIPWVADNQGPVAPANPKIITR